MTQYRKRMRRVRLQTRPRLKYDKFAFAMDTVLSIESAKICHIDGTLILTPGRLLN